MSLFEKMHEPMDRHLFSLCEKKHDGLSVNTCAANGSTRK